MSGGLRGRPSHRGGDDVQCLLRSPRGDTVYLILDVGLLISWTGAVNFGLLGRGFRRRGLEISLEGAVNFGGWGLLFR